jgi:transcriptional regulator with GAF, ATPase, and Fis domain
LLWFDCGGGLTPDRSLADRSRIQRTKQQIRSLVSEIGQLVSTNVRPDVFYSEFLPRVVSALAAEGGAVWDMDEQGRLALAYQMGLQKTRLAEREEDQKQHARLLSEVMNLPAGDGLLVPPHSGSDDDDDDDEKEAANPTDFLLVLAALRTNIETVGIVEIFQRPDSPATTRKGYLRFLLQMCELANDFLARHQQRVFADAQVYSARWDRFTQCIHASLNLRETAQTIADEGRQVMQCDRVSVAVCQRDRCRLQAISGHARFDKRSAAVRRLEELVAMVVAGGEPFWYAGERSDLPPRLADAAQAYVNETRSKAVAVLPLRRSLSPQKADPGKPPGPGPVLGALVVELAESDRFSPGLVGRMEAVCLHGSIALNNALEHRQSFLGTVWRAWKRRK